jgi:hypothetical protein
MYISINPLSRIHNTILIIAYFGLDSRESECLEYLFIFTRIYSGESLSTFLIS